MTAAEMHAVCVNAIRQLESKGHDYAADALKEVADALLRPHPDTARADAAEKMLAGVMESLRWADESTRLFTAVYDAVPGLREWWVPRFDASEKARRLADLTAERDRRRAALEAAERELEGLTR